MENESRGREKEEGREDTYIERATGPCTHDMECSTEHAQSFVSISASKEGRKTGIMEEKRQRRTEAGKR